MSSHRTKTIKYIFKVFTPLQNVLKDIHRQEQRVMNQCIYTWAPLSVSTPIQPRIPCLGNSAAHRGWVGPPPTSIIIIKIITYRHAPQADLL